MRPMRIAVVFFKAEFNFWLDSEFINKKHKYTEHFMQNTYN